MARWLEAAKSQTRKIVHDLRGENPDLILEVGAVFYRDFGDEHQFIVIPFTENVDNFVERIRPVMPTGGDDTCEDVAGGFARMHGMNWEGADVKHLFFITDAPAHGRSWHTISIEDRFPDMGEELDELVQDAALRNIRLTFIRFTDIVVPMIERMDQIYGREGKHITVVNLEPQTPPHRPRSMSPPLLPYRYGGFAAPPLSLGDTPEAILLTRTVSRMVSDSIRTHPASSQEDPLDL